MTTGHPSLSRKLMRGLGIVLLSLIVAVFARKFLLGAIQPRLQNE